MSVPAFKMLVVYPQARYAAERAFIEAEIDPGHSANWINETLSASGNSPSTHGWCCFHADILQALKWCTRLGALALQAVPVNFETMDRGDQITWINSIAAPLVSNAGSYVAAVANDAGDTITPPIRNAAPAALGLQKISHISIDEEL